MLIVPATCAAAAPHNLASGISAETSISATPVSSTHTFPANDLTLAPTGGAELDATANETTNATADATADAMTVGQALPGTALSQVPDAMGDRFDLGPWFAGGTTLQQYLDSMWQMVSWVHGDAERPRVKVVRAIPPSEAAVVTANCLRSEGFPAATLADGSGVDPGPEAHGDLLRYHLALYVCAARFPVLN